MPLLRERFELRMPDGAVYRLENGASAFILSDEGLGIPPIEYVTERGVYQHGETMRAYYLRPRIVQLIARRNFCNRLLYWAGRTQLINAVRPNRTVLARPTVLRKYLPNGAIRDLDVYIEQGPAFAARQLDRWDEYSYSETLRLIAYDPTFYDPTVRTLTVVSPTEGGEGGEGEEGEELIEQLQFPITFPILFQSFQETTDITYGESSDDVSGSGGSDGEGGNWLTHPTITIVGPITNVIIRNETTDEQIAISYVLDAGETITIDLRYGVKSVTKNDGTNLIGYVSSLSDLGTFHLTPANGGVNTISVYGSATSSATSVTFTWFNRYIGI